MSSISPKSKLPGCQVSNPVNCLRSWPYVTGHTGTGVFVMWEVHHGKATGCRCSWSTRRTHCSIGWCGTMSTWLHCISAAFPCAGILCIPDPAARWVFHVDMVGLWCKSLRENLWGSDRWEVVNVLQDSASKQVHRTEIHAPARAVLD